LQAIVKYAAMAQSADMTWKFYDRNSADMVELEEKRGVTFVVTPKPVLEAQLKTWDKIVGEESSKNPFFAKVIKSQREWAARTVPWRQKIMAENNTAFDHYFQKKG
jgi:TRAP-type mannitol/chloroaromatic compound transport system substrate-binding protein